MSNVRSVSLSRRYVAMCIKPRGAGVYFRTFELPDYVPENNSQSAMSHYINQLDDAATVNCCIALEDYQDIGHEDGRDRNHTEIEVTVPEQTGDEDAYFDVCYDLHCLKSGHGNPHKDVRIPRHIARHLQKHNPSGDGDYTTRYDAKYRERYEFWLNVRESLALKN